MQPLVRFEVEDLALFTAASGDRNPLHVSADYSRRTAFGEPVVFGIMGALGCLQHSPIAATRRLRKLSLQFRSPLWTGTSYHLSEPKEQDARWSARLLDGSRRLLSLSLEFADAAGLPAFPEGALECRSTVPADWDLSEVEEAVLPPGRYRPDWKAVRALLARFSLEGRVAPSEIGALLWSSYFVGMERPGGRALFSELRLRFADSQGRCDALEYRAEVKSKDERFALVSMSASLSSAGEPLAAAEISSFVMPRLPRESNSEVEKLLPRSSALSGRVALVIGGTRGLGASLVRTLVMQGASVFASYLRGREEAEMLRRELEGLPGSVEFVCADAASLDDLERLEACIAERSRSLDMLICSAAPSLNGLWLELASLERLERYFTRALSMAVRPMARFLPRLQASNGLLVAISSAAITDPIAEWPHYVAAKMAVEGLVRTAVLEYRKVSALIVRPPRLRTDLVNRPMGLEGALAPRSVATAVVRRAMGEPFPGQAVVLESFGSGEG